MNVKYLQNRLSTLLPAVHQNVRPQRASSTLSLIHILLLQPSSRFPVSFSFRLHPLSSVLSHRFHRMLLPIQGFKEILEGKHDEIPEGMFLNAGTIEEVVERFAARNK